MNATYDCIVIGGGPAGLSAALTLGRARRTTLLVDAGAQSNLPAHGVGGLLGHDRRPPAELYATARVELGAYPSIDVRDGSITTIESAGDMTFDATLQDGSIAQARRLVLATGMDYRHPELPGIAERWGETVFHCPFCHGWEVHGRPLAVLSQGAVGVHQALLLRAWSDDVTLLSGDEADGADALDEDSARRLAEAGVTVQTSPAQAILGDGTAIEAIALADGGEVRCDAVLVASRLYQRSPLAARLGVEIAPPNPMTEDAIVVDDMQSTNVAGVYAGGDVLGRPPSVAGSIASGHMAGAMVVASLFV